MEKDWRAFVGRRRLPAQLSFCFSGSFSRLFLFGRKKARASSSSFSSFFWNGGGNQFVISHSIAQNEALFPFPPSLQNSRLILPKMLFAKRAGENTADYSQILTKNARSLRNPCFMPQEMTLHNQKHQNSNDETYAQMPNCEKKGRGRTKEKGDSPIQARYFRYKKTRFQAICVYYA